MTPWTPLRSAVAACLIDGMTVRESALAIGCAATTVQRHRQRMATRHGLRVGAPLAAKLLNASAPPLNRPMGTGEPNV